jgi:hypothetical protein
LEFHQTKIQELNAKMKYSKYQIGYRF